MTTGTELRWFALRTAPQEETKTVNILRRQNLLVSVPTETRWRKRGHYDKVKVEKRFVAMPGYVLIGWAPGPIPWWSALRFRVVRSVIGYRPEPTRDDPMPAYQPLQLDRECVERMLEKDTLSAPSFYKFMRTWGEYSPGDKVRVISGPFEGFESKVVAVTGGEAEMLLPMFGSERAVKIHASQLEKAA